MRIRDHQTMFGSTWLATNMIAIVAPTFKNSPAKNTKVPPMGVLLPKASRAANNVLGNATATKPQAADCAWIGDTNNMRRHTATPTTHWSPTIFHIFAALPHFTLFGYVYSRTADVFLTNRQIIGVCTPPSQTKTAYFSHRFGASLKALLWGSRCAEARRRVHPDC